MEKNLVSVIIPFYKGVDWLTESIESVLSQTYSNIEIIVINDGSQEDLTKVYENYNNKIKFVFQENKGAAFARNVGINLSKGRYVAFLDADDIWMENKLEVQISSMIRKKAMWSHTNYEIFGENVKGKIVNTSGFQGDISAESIISNPIATPSVIIKKTVLNNPDFRFDENLNFGEDTILWFKLSREYNILSINQSLVKVRIRGTNSARMAYSQLKARANTWMILQEEKKYKQKLSVVSKIGFIYCFYVYKILLEKSNIKNIEKLSRVLYIIPWTVFKIEKIRLMKKRNRGN